MEEIISHMEGCMPKEVTKKEEIPENQVMSKERHRAKEAFFYEGNKYISLGQCCEFYGINESSVRSRAWRKKCTWEEAVKYYIQKKETETPKMQFFYKGKGIKVFQHVVLNTALMLPVCVTVPKQQNAALKNLWIIS